MTFSPIDGVVAVILAIAVLRGLLRGLIREAFSIAALGSACVAVRFGTGPLGDWLDSATGGELGGTAAAWAAGILLAIFTIAAVAILGKMLRRGAKAVGLGWADRLGGGALGAAEGALVAALLLTGALWVVGRSHPVFETSRSVTALENLQVAVAARDEAPPGDVAAPPR